MDHRTPPTRPCEPPASTLHHAYRWTIPADHPARERYDRAVAALSAYLGDEAGVLLGDLDAAVDAMLEVAVGAAGEASHDLVRERDDLRRVLSGVAAGAQAALEHEEAGR